VLVGLGEMLLSVAVSLSNPQLRFGAFTPRSCGLLGCRRALGLRLRGMLPRLQQVVSGLSLTPLGRLLLSLGRAPAHPGNQQGREHNQSNYGNHQNDDPGLHSGWLYPDSRKGARPRQDTCPGVEAEPPCTGAMHGGDATHVRG
jgi:hypothetical protein